MNLLLIFTSLLLTAWLLTGALRRYALARSIIDIPNERSSHTVPTPRGGGVAIVISFLVAVPLLALLNLLDWNEAIALLGAGTGIALLGFLDDLGHIAARWRLLGHFSGAAWVLFWLGGFPQLTILDYRLPLGSLGHVLGLLYIVWLLNLYNFMDGIDGLASVEAITVSLGGVLLYVITGHFNEIWAPIALTCATTGFLVWNFPPARIFMGDAGSGFLGISLATLSLQAGNIDSQLFFGWLILLGVFIVDSTMTLIRRLIRGEKIYEAHRSHAYQFASRRFGRHLPVTLGVMAINLVWLMPLSCLVAIGVLDGAVGVIVAYAPLAVLAIVFNAGQAEGR